MSEQEAALKNDLVNHPAHYTSGSVECIVAIEAALGEEGFICFLRGQVIKYLWRLGKKDSSLQDAEKAQFYQNMLVKKIKDKLGK